MKRLNHSRALKTSAIAATVAATLLVSGCTAPPEQTKSSAAVTAFSHVHGLGIDSASGVAYAATHQGVFILPPLESPTVGVIQLGGPVSGLVQDTMAFTVEGSQLFASGHPGADELAAGTAPNLGLITSVDGASSWETLSLGGEADFHALTAAVNQNGVTQLYGYHGGAVLFSEDGGISWVTGAELAIRDLAADAEQAGIVYATTQDGLAVSSDYGSSFELIPDAPVLYLVDAMPDADGLIGVDLDGQVWVNSSDSGWRVTGSAIGAVQAMTFSDHPTPALLIADDRGVVVSDDLGVTWRVLVAK